MNSKKPLSQLDGPIVVPDLPNTSVDDISDSVEMAWEERDLANKELLYCLSTLLIKQVKLTFPTAHAVILREDTSHLPPHGHIDDIREANGRSLFTEAPHGNHDWPLALDDLAWDIYHIASHAFHRDNDGVKRLVIVLSDSP